MDTLWSFGLHVSPSLGFRFVTGFCFNPRWAYEDVGKKVLYITLIGIHKQHYCPERFLCIADKGMYKWHRPQRRFEVLTPCDCRKMLTFTNVMTCHKLSWHSSTDKTIFQMSWHFTMSLPSCCSWSALWTRYSHYNLSFSRSIFHILGILMCLQAGTIYLAHSLDCKYTVPIPTWTRDSLSRYVNIDLWCLLRHYCIKLQIQHILLTGQPKR